MIAIFEKITDTIGFNMKTSKNGLQKFFKYGKVNFKINGASLQLFIYKSESLRMVKEYADYLFVPFTDKTTGDETYGSGRYIDIRIPEIINNKLVIDFNKAYNPYCAYVTTYQCPLPPRENNLPASIKAGEKKFKKEH